MFRIALLVLLFNLNVLNGIESLSFKELVELNTTDPEAIRSHLADYIDQEVQIRGFIYKNDEGRSVLSSKPTIASCCQKKEENLSHQIFLDGLTAESSGRVVAVQGFFTLDPVRDRTGKLLELYKLKNPAITPNDYSFVIPLIGFSLIALISLLWFQGKYRLFGRS